MICYFRLTYPDTDLFIVCFSMVERSSFDNVKHLVDCYFINFTFSIFICGCYPIITKIIIWAALFSFLIIFIYFFGAFIKMFTPQIRLVL